jgi:pyrroline-5-carboxylate reductase
MTLRPYLPATQGTGRMVLNGLHPAQLKDSVTSTSSSSCEVLIHSHPKAITFPAPGGCTIAGLLTLEDGRVRSTIARAIQVAANHAAGLGQDSKK